MRVLSSGRVVAMAAMAGLLLASCAMPVPITRIQERFGDGAPAAVTLVDKRLPVAGRAPEVETRMGVGLRVDEAVFAQPPLEALGHVLGEALAEDRRALRGPVEVLALDVVRVPTTSNAFGRTAGLPAAANPMAGVAGVAIVGGIDAAVRTGNLPDVLFVKAVLSYGGKVANCEGSDLFPKSGYAGPAWRTAMRRAGGSCANALVSLAP
jgi:hypothetical protein